MQGQLGALGDLGAGRHILFLNTKGVDGKISHDLEALFEYINGGEDSIGKETDNELVKLIDDYVEKTNKDEQWRAEYMKYMFDMEDQFDKGKSEGVAQGRAEAFAEAEAKYKVKEAQAKEEKAQSVKAMYADHVSVDKIAKYVSLPESEVQSILSAK